MASDLQTFDDGDWKKAVIRCQKEISTHISKLLVDVPPIGRPACRRVADGAPKVMESILELERLHKSKKQVLDASCSELDKAIADNKTRGQMLKENEDQLQVEQNQVRRQHQLLKFQQDNLDTWGAYKNKLVTDATTEKNVTNEKLAACQRAYEELKDVAAKSKGEADLARIELALANNMVESLQSSWEDNRLLLIANAELKKQSDGMKKYQIDFDAARHLQDISQQRIAELEKENRRLTNECRGLQMENTTFEDMLSERDDFIRTKDAAIELGRLRRIELSAEIESLEDEVADLKRQVANNLNTQPKPSLPNLKRRHDLLDREETRSNDARSNLQGSASPSRDHLLQTTSESIANADHRQPQSSTPSRERDDDHLDPEEEETSSLDPKRIARRAEKAPRYEADVRAGGSFSPLDDSTVAEERESSRPLMNVAAPRALGTAKPTFLPTNGAAFAISVHDAKLMNFSSDILPDEILLATHRRFGDWNQRFKWSAQRTKMSLSCLECRSSKQKSQWIDGQQYACALCEQRIRLCLVVDNDQQVVSLLPRKAAIDEGQRPEHATYWRK